MPTYIYQCDRCNIKFEEKSSYSDPLREACINPDCVGEVHVVIPSTPFFFKGKNWKPEKQDDGSRIYTQ